MYMVSVFLVCRWAQWLCLHVVLSASGCNPRQLRNGWANRAVVEHVASSRTLWMRSNGCVYTQAQRARLDKLTTWPIPAQAFSSSQRQPVPQQPAATPPSPRRAPSGPGAVPNSPSSAAPPVTPYLPPLHPDNTLPDPATPYLLVLSLFLWSPDQWTSHSQSVLLHLLRFVFSRTQPSSASPTTDTSQTVPRSPRVTSGVDQAAAGIAGTTSTAQPSSSGSQPDSSTAQSGAGAVQAGTGAAQSGAGAAQAGSFVTQWQQQSDEELWQAAAPMLRLFGLVNHLQSQLKDAASADWLVTAKARCAMLHNTCTYMVCPFMSLAGFGLAVACTSRTVMLCHAPATMLCQQAFQQTVDACYIAFYMHSLPQILSRIYFRVSKCCPDTVWHDAG